jgi:hypothetical protein
MEPVYHIDALARGPLIRDRLVSRLKKNILLATSAYSWIKELLQIYSLHFKI